MAWVPGQVFRLSYYFSAGDLRACTTRTMRVQTATIQQVGTLAVINAINNALTTLITNLLCQSATLQGFVAWDEFGFGIPLGVAAALNLPGTGAGDAIMPPQVSGRLDLFGSAGRVRNRSRMYLPYPSTADNTQAGTPTADYVGKLDQLGTRLLQSITAQDIDPIPPFPVRSVTFRAVVLPAAGPSSNIAVVRRSQLLWSTQRRRTVPPYNQFSPFG